ncbi:MAG TPA: heme o synthase [Phycisphaerae bacterium]|nr:heme o synthase [Phycisphaerae bacterium]
MSSQSCNVAGSVTARRNTVSGSRLGIYLELTKARLVALVLVTTLVGYVIGSDGAIHWPKLAWTLIGTALAALGANALNQWMEAQRDERMERTRNRPLPSGRMTARHAFGVALSAVVAAPIVLCLATNLLAAVLALAATLIYLALYTPLKSRSPLCTLVGAVCGALPPMVGWCAATGRLGPGAWVLGATLFAWQIPHSLALAWLYRDDYARGGFRMLPVVDRAGNATGVIVILWSLALLPIGLAATLVGLAGWRYAVGSLLLGTALLALGIKLYRQRSDLSARRLFLASIIYLPLLLGFMVADRGPVADRVHVIGAVENVQAAAPPADLGQASVYEHPS